MTYNKQLIRESLDKYKVNSADKKLKTVENLKNSLKNITKPTELSLTTQILLRTIEIYKL